MRVASVVGALVLGSFVCGCDSGGVADDSFDATDKKRAKWVRSEITERNAWLDEEVRAEKYAEMAESPLAFFRGTSHLYYADLAKEDRLDDYGTDETRTFLQGDLHVGNYGSFHDDEGQVVYDLNDHDEAFVGDYQLDLWRGAVSIALVGEGIDLSATDQRAAVEAFAKAYVHACEDFADGDAEDDFAMTAGNADGPLADFLADVESKSSRGKMLGKWTSVVDGERRLLADHDDLAPIDEGLRQALVASLPDYGATLSGGLDFDESYFEVKDVALRLHAGVASLGVPRFYLLVEGPTTSLDDDVLLDVKYAAAPTGLEYVDEEHGFSAEAERIVAGQKAQLINTDNHLGWLALDGDSYVVRERSPYKDDLDLEEVDGADALESLAAQWGTILAADHARADDDFDDHLVPTSLEEGVLDAVEGRRTKFYANVWKVASSYATQVRADRKAFLPMTE
jgi:uncharacterized protein (DUF2252 family)